MFRYKVIDKDNKVVFEGTAKEVKSKYYISCISTYANNKELLMGQYRVEKALERFYPKEKEEYYYYSLTGNIPVRAYWDSRQGNCLAYHKAGNVFRTREQCVRFGKVLLDELQTEFIKLV